MAVHWSDCSRTNQCRQEVRFEYHHPDLRPIDRSSEQFLRMWEAARGQRDL